MFCPRCGYQQVSEETRFCSSCGLLMDGIPQMVAYGGFSQIPKLGGNSPRKKGLKGGLFLFLSTFLVVPLVALLTIALDIEPFAVAAVAIITFWGGILRMIYALLFESNIPNEKTLEEKVKTATKNFLNKRQESNILPPHQTMPVSGYRSPMAGNWRDTNDLAQEDFRESRVNRRN